IDTANATRSAASGIAPKSTSSRSSSPSPAPVVLSPLCTTEPSGVRRLLKKTKCRSVMILPDASSTRAEASRSKSAPVVVRRSQPRPTLTVFSPGACFVSETFPPLVRLTPTLGLLIACRSGTPARRPGLWTLQRCYPFPPCRTHRTRPCPPRGIRCIYARLGCERREAALRGAGDQRRRGRAAQAAAAAVEAREAAATAFYDMDQAQKFIDGRVTVFEDLDAGAAEPARREFTGLAEAADAAAHAYISVLDAHDLDSPDRSPAEYDAARRAFAATTERMQKITHDLNGFAERLAPRMARLEAALDQLPPRLTAGRDGVAAAEAAVTAAREAGMDASDPEAELAGAKEILARLGSRGLGGFGLDGAMRKADEAREIAERAREAAAELPQMAQKVRNSLASVRT